MKENLNVYFVGDTKYNSFRSSTVEECYQYLLKKPVISLDIETTRKFGGKYGKQEGLNPRLSEIVMLQIGTKDRQYVIDYRVTDVSRLMTLLTDSAKTIVGQNIKFEYVHLLHNENVRINKVYDTMIVEQILFNGLSPGVSLKALNEKYLSITVDKSTALEFLSIGSKPFTEKQVLYGAEDILYPLLIRDYQLDDAYTKDVTNCINLEMLFTEVLGDIEYKGMHFDTDVWTSTYEENLKEFKQLERELDKYVLTRHAASQFIDRQYNLFSSEKKTTISWTSSKQVIGFFKFLRVCPLETSKTTGNLAYTVNAKVLSASLNTINKSVQEHVKELILLYLKFKKREQACTTFGISFFKHINPVTNRLHSSYRQILNTGRISSKNPNLQNIPANNGFRGAFRAPKGYKIINADYSGQEQIILANKSNDKDLIHFYKQGFGDMHSYIASKIFPELNEVALDDIKKYHKNKRQIAKAAGFAINYGGNGHTIAKNLGIPDRQGDEVYDAYFKAFPELKKYFDKVQKEAHRRGYILIDPLSGRKYWFHRPRDNKARGAIDRNALNYPIQGEASGITKLAPVLFRKWIIENNLTNVIAITNLVHDEINVEARDDYAELAANHLERCMVEAGEKWCKTVSLKADAVITDWWTH